MLRFINLSRKLLQR